MKIAVLTGGGDVPGLNPCIKNLVTGALARGWQVVGIRNGWQGLLALNSADPQSIAKYTVPLDALAVRKIDRDGGTFLHSARTNPSNVKAKEIPDFLKNSSAGVKHTKTGKDGQQTEVFDFTKHVLKNLQALGIDVLVPIGGDDTLSYGERLYKEGYQVVGIPKTMDNDVHGTEYCLGYGTCVARSVEYINQLRSCTGSHERFLIVEVMGRNAGWTSLVPAYLASADRAVIAEVPVHIGRLAKLLMADREQNPSKYAIVVVSEGAVLEGGEIIESGEADAYGHRKLGGIGQIIGAELQKLTGVGIMCQNLGYLVRSGPPDPLDVMVTYNFANLALELIAKKQFGQLVRIKDGRYGHAPMSILSEGIRRVEIDKFYDKENYKPLVKSVLDMPLYLR